MHSQPPDAPTETVTGHLERVVYHNPDTGWGILTIARDGQEPLTAAGLIAAPASGESLRLHGRWETHPRYGRQFRFERYELLRPTTPEAIVRYLSSGAIKGIGPALAGEIVKRFGDQTLEVLDHDPDRLQAVPGIGPARLKAIREAWQAHEQQRRILLFLYQHGLGVALSRKIMERYAARAIEVVERDPYRLAMDISGIGFVIADRIARAQGVALDDPMRLQAGLLHCLERAVSDGHFFLPLPLLLSQASGLTGMNEEQLRYALDLLVAQGKAVTVGDETGDLAVYRTEMDQEEREAAARLRELLHATARSVPHQGALEGWLADQESFTGIELTPEQRAAVLTALRHPLCVITGGPGTGKTTIVRFLAHVGVQGGRTLALAAPTGRAAQRLEQVTGHSASTIHRLLSYDPFRHGFRHGLGNPLSADWVIIDEASMLEVPLANCLLRALPPGANLLLVGDADQLPSVGPGALLGDLVASGEVPVVRLEHIHRQAAGSLIVQNAHRINRGDPPLFPTPQTWRQGEDCVFVEKNDPAEIAQRVVQLVTGGLIRMGFGAEATQVITSMHRGPIGVQELNRRLQATVNPPAPNKPEMPRGETRFRLGDRVLQTVNDYEKMVFNGDIGRVVDVDLEGGALAVLFGENRVTYLRSDLDQLELAYALTVHKSQGSEFPAVVLVVHSSHYIMLHRNLLYTGVTRAREMLCVVGDQKGLHKALRSTHLAERHTRLAQRLRGEM
jgi:exodeoxyribonuclease V alpha subunit